MCARFVRPHAEHRFSDVMSSMPLPAMNRVRFFMYDVFFLGTAFRMPSQISPSEGNDGSDSDGMASAANGVDCARRCRNGRFRMGRTGPLMPLRPGISVCHSGGSGRASAMVRMCGGIGGAGSGHPRWRGDGVGEQNAPQPELRTALTMPVASALSLAPFPAPATPRESRQRNVPNCLLLQLHPVVPAPPPRPHHPSTAPLTPRPAAEAHITRNGCRTPAVHLPGQLCRFRQHHQADREEVGEAGVPVQRHLRW